MITEKDLICFLNDSSPKKLIIHDGYDGWSYGMPLDPIFINNETALKLIKIIEKNNKISVFDVLLREKDIKYANEDDKLYRKTFRNSFLGLYSTEECKFSDRSEILSDVNIDI